MTETPSSNGEYNQLLTTKNEEEISFDKVFLPSNDKEENVSKIILKCRKNILIYPLPAFPFSLCIFLQYL